MPFSVPSVAPWLSIIQPQNAFLSDLRGSVVNNLRGEHTPPKMPFSVTSVAPWLTISVVNYTPQNAFLRDLRGSVVNNLRGEHTPPKCLSSCPPWLAVSASPCGTVVKKVYVPQSRKYKKSYPTVRLLNLAIGGMIRLK